MRVSHSMKSYQTGRQAIADGDIGATRAAFRWTVGQDPENPVYTYASATAALKAGREGEAETLLRQAMADTVVYLSYSHPHLVTVVHTLAQLYLKQARQDDARILCGEIVAKIDSKAAAAANSRTLWRLAVLFRTAGRPSDAGDLYQLALAYRRIKYGDSHPKVAECRAGLAEINDHPDSCDGVRALRKPSTKPAGGRAKPAGSRQKDTSPAKRRPSRPHPDTE